MQLSLSLGECGVGRIQLLHLSLQVKVLLCEASLQVVEIVVLLTEVINLDFEPSTLVIEGISFAFGMSLKEKVGIALILLNYLFSPIFGFPFGALFTIYLPFVHSHHLSLFHV